MTEQRVVIAADRPGLPQVHVETDPDRGRAPVWSTGAFRGLREAAVTLDALDKAGRRPHGAAA